jgi:hypothetical protein
VSFTPQPLYPRGKSTECMDTKSSREYGRVLCACGPGEGKETAASCSCKRGKPVEVYGERENIPIFRRRKVFHVSCVSPETILLRIKWTVSPHPTKRTRNSSVSIATGYGLDGQGSIPGRGKIYFSTPPRSDRFLGPPNFLSNGYRGEVKRTGREAGHSHPSCAEIKILELYLRSPMRINGALLV